MTNNEINITATCIATLANQTNSQEKIKILLTSLLASNEKPDFNEQKNTDSSVSSIIKLLKRKFQKWIKILKKYLF